jgi:S-adenosylmethionine-dependent methyltransferase
MSKGLINGKISLRGDRLMDENTAKVRKYYDQGPQIEWRRLAKHQAEFALTLFMMEKYLTPRGSILDLGGGPGRYAIHFAKAGHPVTLVDLSAGNIRYAKKKARYYKADLSAYASDCLELGKLNLGMYDDVFLMGPLYHLKKEEDRDRAIRLALSHLKKGGHFFCSFIMNIGGLLYDLKAGPGFIEKDMADPQTGDLFKSLLEHRSYTGPAFCPAVFSDWTQIEPALAKYGLKKEVIFAQEGFLGPFEEKFNSCPPRERKIWLELAEKLASYPEYGFLSEHQMYIGTKE